MSCFLRPHSILFLFFLRSFPLCRDINFIIYNGKFNPRHDPRQRTNWARFNLRTRKMKVDYAHFVCFSPLMAESCRKRMKFQFEMNERDFPSCWPHRCIDSLSVGGRGNMEIFRSFRASRLWQTSYIYNTARCYFNLDINEFLHRKRPLWGSSEGGWKRKEREIEEKRTRANLTEPICRQLTKRN